MFWKLPGFAAGLVLRLQQGPAKSRTLLAKFANLGKGQGIPRLPGQWGMGVEWVWEWQGNRRPQDVERHASRPATLGPLLPAFPKSASPIPSSVPGLMIPLPSSPLVSPQPSSTQGQIARSSRPWLLREKTTHPSPGSFFRVLKKREKEKNPLPTAPRYSVSHGDLSSHQTHHRRPKTTARGGGHTLQRTGHAHLALCNGPCGHLHLGALARSWLLSANGHSGCRAQVTLRPR